MRTSDPFPCGSHPIPTILPHAMSVREAVSFINRARDELQSSKPDRADLLLELALEHLSRPGLLHTVESVSGALPADRMPSVLAEPRPVQPVLALRKKRGPNPLRSPLKQYVNMWSLGYPFRFCDVAEWVENANLGIILDLSAGSNKRSHWRKQLSNALESLCKSRHLDRGVARGHYVVVKHP